MITAVRPRLGIKRQGTSRQRPWKLVLEPGLASRELLARPLALSRAAVLPRVARHRRPLQADRDRRGVGADPPGADDAGVRRLPPAGRRSSRARCRSRCWCLRPSCRGSSSPTALAESSGSLIGNANLISKVYFPRLIIPGAAVVTALVDFLITLGLLAVLMAWYGVAPGWQLLRCRCSCCWRSACRSASACCSRR